MDDTGYTFAGIQLSEWDTFHRYADCIKHLAFEEDDLGLPTHWFAFLLGNATKAAFFPSLKSISCSKDALGSLGLIPLALNSHLESLYLSVSSHPDSERFTIPDDWAEGNCRPNLERVTGLLASVACLAPELEQLHYVGPLAKGIAIPMSQLSKLAVLTLAITSENDFSDIIPEVGNMDSLEKLKLVVLPEWTKQSRSLTQKTGGLTRLVHLEIISSAWTSYYLIHYLGRGTSLKHLANRVTSINSVSYVKRVKSLLASNSNLEGFISRNAGTISLTPLRIAWAKADEKEFLTLLTGHIQRGSMVEVDLVGMPLVTGHLLREAPVLCLAKAPSSNLAIFRFGIPHKLRKNGDEQYLASYDTLRELAYNGCESLKHLDLQFADACFLGSPLLPTERSHHGLQTLSIITDADHLDLSVQQEISISMFLDRLFPSLTMVWGTAKDQWDDINALIQSYQQTRKYALEMCSPA